MWLTWGSFQDSVRDYIRMCIISGHISFNYCCYHFTCQNNARQARALMKIITYKMCQKHSNAFSTVLLFRIMCLGLAGKDICALAPYTVVQQLHFFFFLRFYSCSIQHACHNTAWMLSQLCYSHYGSWHSRKRCSCWTFVLDLHFHNVSWRNEHLLCSCVLLSVKMQKKCGHLNFQCAESMPKG